MQQADEHNKDTENMTTNNNNNNNKYQIEMSIDIKVRTGTLPTTQAMTGLGLNGYALDAKSIAREKNKLTQRQQRARLRQIHLESAAKKQPPKSGKQRMQEYRLRKKQSNQIYSYRERNKAQQACSRKKKMMVN